jgi:DNA polymerase elongation subunit (family B)
MKKRRCKRNLAGKYQGAIVRNWKTGMWRMPLKAIYPSIIKYPIIHNDVKSQYPSIFVLLNLSPETVYLISRKRYTGQYRFDADKRIIEVPDNKLGQLTLGISDQDSITRNHLIDLFNQREKLRENPYSFANESAQLKTKIDMNATYGYHGQDFSMFGSFLCAIACTAVGRLVIVRMIRKSNYHDLIPLECDTDGLYDYTTKMTGAAFVKIVNDDLHQYFSDWEYSKFLRIEMKEYKAMFIYKMKNYILQKKDGSLKFKGSGLHGQGMPPICHAAIDDFATAMFKRTPFSDEWKKYNDLKLFPLKSFVLSCNLKKRHDQYDSSTVYAKLINLIPHKDRKYIGNDMYYVKLRSKYMPLGILEDDEVFRRLDFKYYKQRIRKAVSERLLEPFNPSLYKKL